MQYDKGSVSTTHDSATITGDISEWDDEIEPGNIFIIPGENTSYEVASVTDDTTLVLTSTYQGSTGSGKAYVIARSFTPVYGIPYIEPGDAETAEIFKRAVMKIEELIAGLES